MNEKELAKMCNKSTSDCIELARQLKEAQDRINVVVDDMKHFHLIYNEEGKLISSDKSIFARIRYFIDKLEGTIPATMTPFEHGLWEKENRIKEIPQFEGTLEQLDKLSIRGEEDESN